MNGLCRVFVCRQGGGVDPGPRDDPPLVRLERVGAIGGRGRDLAQRDDCEALFTMKHDVYDA